MGTVQKSLRIAEETLAAIEEVSREQGVDFSAAANQLLEEAVRMRRCPGVVFTSGPTGRRATIAGTGIDVWEIVATLESVGGDEQKLHRAYHFLSEPQLRAALAYRRLYPRDIERRLRKEREVTPETLRRRHPTLVAPARRPVRRR